MHYDCVVLGKIIRDFRKERGLTQEVLSGLAGISRSHLAMIENGKKKANFQTITEKKQFSTQLSTLINNLSTVIHKNVENPVDNRRKSRG